jgi:hypothetical protein
MSTKWSDPSCTVCCIMTDSTVLVVCTLASMPVRYPNWLETNAECLTCEYGEAWLALQLVMERWMPWSVKHGISLWSTSLDTVRQVRHSLVNYISLDIGDIVWVHSLWRYCIPASWHFTVHPHLPIQETKWQLTWLWHVWYFICDDTLSQRQCHGNIIVIFICYKICMPTCYIYITQTCYIEHFY